VIPFGPAWDFWAAAREPIASVRTRSASLPD
jgi:hypothetical protein